MCFCVDLVVLVRGIQRLHFELSRIVREYVCFRVDLVGFVRGVLHLHLDEFCGFQDDPRLKLLFVIP